MALYHFNCTIRSRSSGSNAVAISAYNSGEKLVDEKTGKTKYYRNKRDTVIYDEIMLPPNAPSEYKSRQNLWNSVEKESNRKDSQLVRSYNIACQQEFTRAENIELLKNFCEMERQEGKCVDLCVHDPGFHGPVNDAYLNSLSDGNLHGHLETTMTSIDGEGNWNPRRIERFVYEKDINGNVIMEPILDKKGNPKINKDGSTMLQKKRVPIIDKKTGKQKLYKGRKVWKKEIVETDSLRWNSDEFFTKERALWEKLVNDKFQEKYEQLSASYEKTHSENDRLALLRITDPVTGGPVQISKDSYETQEVEKIPSIHLGYKAAAMEARGIKTDRGDINREIQEANDKLLNLSGKHLQLITEIESIKKDINEINKMVVTEKSYVGKLQKENSHITKVIDAMQRNAETFLGSRLSKQELDELQPLWEKYAISSTQKNYQQIIQCVKNVRHERKAVRLVNQVSQHFTGSLDSQSWNRLFIEAKTAYDTKNFAEFCDVATKVLYQNIKRGIVPKPISDSMDLVKKAVGRELSDVEFAKVAKYKFWAIFTSKNSSTWENRLIHFAEYKQGETNIDKVMAVSIPETENELVKLQNSLTQNRFYVDVCNDRCNDIAEPHIDAKKYDDKAKVVDRALKAISGDKKIVADFEEKVKLFTKNGIGKMPNATAITIRTEQLNSIVDEYEVTKQCMRRLEITSRGFWLSREKSMKQVDTELEEEQRRIKEAEEQLENAKNQELEEKTKENEALQDRLRLISLAVEQIDQQKKEEPKRNVKGNQGEVNRVQSIVVPVEKTNSASNVDKPMKESLVALPAKSSPEVVCEEISTERSVIQKQKAPHRTIRKINLMNDYRVRKVSVSITWEDGKTTTYSADKYNQMWSEHCEDIQNYNGQVNEKRRVTLERLKGQIDGMIAYTLEKRRGHKYGHGPKR